MNRAERRAQAREAGRGRRRGVAVASASMVALGASGAFLGLSAAPVSASVSDVVSNLNDAGTGSLRAAILDANGGGGGTITFQAGLTGTITLASNLPPITQPLTITGPGASALAVDGASSFREFYLTVPQAVTISGLTLQHSSWAPLAVIDGGTMTADSMVVVDNASTQARGGGFYCSLSGADSVGPAQALSNFTLTNSTVTGNSSTDGGGGGYAGDCNVTIATSTIADNAALTGTDGGGLYFRHGGTREIENTTISGNTADDNSGGAYIYQGAVTISNSTIVGNTAATDAGAISVNGGASLSLVQSTVTGNTVTAPTHSSSGALYLLGGTSAGAAGQRAANPNNTGASAAGDVHALDAGPVSIVGTILSGNTNASDPNSFDISSGGNTATVSSDHSLLGTHEAAVTVSDLGGTLTGVDPMLGPLANNGGSTQTEALLVGSPAIDKGPNPLPTFPLNDNDQRGAGFPRVVGPAVDIGAFEVQPPPPSPTPAPAVIIAPKFTG